MNKYLKQIVKTAESFKDRHIGAAAVGTIGGVYAGMAVSGPANGPISKAMHRDGPMTHGELRKVLKANKDLNTTFSVHRAFKGSPEAAHHVKSHLGKAGPFFAGDEIRQIFSHDPDKGKYFSKPMHKNFVNMKLPGGKGNVKDLTIALHELGHAKDFNTGSKLLRRAKNISHMGSSFAHKSGLGVAIGGAMSLSDKTKDYAWTAPVVAAAPLLRSEAAANYHGYQMSKNHISKASRNSFLRLAGKNMLGYGAPVAAAAGAIYGANKLFNKKDKK
jgi:hypothetical protein